MRAKKGFEAENEKAVRHMPHRTELIKKGHSGHFSTIAATPECPIEVAVEGNRQTDRQIESSTRPPALHGTA